MKNNIIEGEITGLSSNAQGILRHQDLVVFVPFTAPGDKIKCEIISRKKNFAIGKLVEILHPGSERTAPLCRYYGNCGGCQLQHLNYSAQLIHKRQIVDDALKRIGKIQNIETSPVVPAVHNWAYRRHINLKLHSDSKVYKAGYISIDNHSLVEVQHCPIFISESDSCLQELQELIGLFTPKSLLGGSLNIFKVEQNKFILTFYFEDFSIYDASAIQKYLAQHPLWLGLILHEKNKKTIFGQAVTHLNTNGMEFTCSPAVFTQNHPEQSSKIYEQILQLGNKQSKSKILDLYCGIGISSILLAKMGHDVLGIEYNHESIHFAKQNAAKYQLENSQFLQGDVEILLPNLLKKQGFDFVIVNPPRIGMSSKVVQTLINHKPKNIVYISCMPSTLARDLKLFVEAGYQIKLVQPYDMFPQTLHVETVVHLSSYKLL